MATTEVQPAPTEHQPLQRRVHPTEGQPTEIPIRWENTGVEETIPVEVTHEQIAMEAVKRAANLRAGRFLSRGNKSGAIPEPDKKPEEAKTPVVDYLESRGRQAKLGRRLMGMRKWTPAVFEWPKDYAPKHLNEDVKINSTPNVAYKGRHAAKIGERVMQLLDARTAAKAFLGQDGKSTGGKHARYKSETKSAQPTDVAESEQEVRKPRSHRGEPNAHKDFDRKAGGKHKLGVPQSAPKAESVTAPVEALPEDPRIKQTITHL